MVMKHNFYVPTAFDELIKEHNISKSDAARFGILAKDPDAQWLVLLKGQDEMASMPIFADIKQLQRMNDHLFENKYAESYSWFPAHNLDEAQEIWQREAINGRRVVFGILGDIRSFDVRPVAFVSAGEYA